MNCDRPEVVGFGGCDTYKLNYFFIGSYRREYHRPTEIKQICRKPIIVDERNSCS